MSGQDSLQATRRIRSSAFLLRRNGGYYPLMLFVIHGTDNPDSLHIRKATRSAHLEYMATFATPVGGPVLNEAGDMCGSLIILDVEDLQAARAFVVGDPYGAAGLFESVTVQEFKKVSWPGE